MINLDSITIEYVIKNDETRLYVDGEVVCSYDGGYYDTKLDAVLRFSNIVEHEHFKLYQIKKALKDYYIEHRPD